jgi:hypothetical protein
VTSGVSVTHDADADAGDADDADDADGVDAVDAADDFDDAPHAVATAPAPRAPSTANARRRPNVLFSPSFMSAKGVAHHCELDVRRL